MMNIFCTVNYKDYLSTKNYVDSFLELKLENWIVLVVDNSTDSFKLSDLMERYKNNKNVFFLSDDENLGYFGAACKGYEFIANLFSIDIFCISNNDIVFVNDVDWNSIINSILISFDNVGCIAPKIESSITGRDQNPFLIKRQKKSHYLKFKLVFYNYLLTKAIYFFKALKRSNAASQCVGMFNRKPIYAAQGAFFIFTKKFFTSGFNFNQIPFLYAEEICVAEHCLNNALKIIYEPQLVVKHNEHQATGNKMTLFKYVHLKEAVEFILKRFYS